jgi:hypothetical protein
MFRSQCINLIIYLKQKLHFMAQIEKGILGPITGTVGTVVGSSWKGINYIRSKSSGRRSSSVEQLDQQFKFSAAINFVSTMADLLKMTFKNYAVKKTESNAALSYTLRNAITGTSPDYQVDFAKALVSHGNLPNATAPAATVTGKAIHFTWTDNSGSGKAAATDKAVLVAYCKNYNQTIFTTASAVRSAGAAVLDVSNFAGFEAEVWIAFLSADGMEASNSIYLGELMVS